MPGGTQLSEVKSGKHPFHQSVARIGRQVDRGPGPRPCAGSSTATSSPRICCWMPKEPSGSPTSAWPKPKTKHDEDRRLCWDVALHGPRAIPRSGERTSDVYSLGLSLYELLVLRVPFKSADRLHLIEQIKNDEPTRPRAIDPRIPRNLETIVLKAIEKDPKRRYATAAELGEDLQRFIEGAPVRRTAGG